MLGRDARYFSWWLLMGKNDDQPWDLEVPYIFRHTHLLYLSVTNQYPNHLLPTHLTRSFSQQVTPTQYEPFLIWLIRLPISSHQFTNRFSSIQWPFQVPKLEVPTIHIQRYGLCKSSTSGGYSPKIRLLQWYLHCTAISHWMIIEILKRYPIII